MSNSDKSDVQETYEYSVMFSVQNINSPNCSDSEIISETGTTSRKRKRCPELWKRNVAKRAR